VTALRSNTFYLCHGTRFLKSRNEIFFLYKSESAFTRLGRPEALGTPMRRAH